MERLKAVYKNRLRYTPMQFQRDIINKIHWEARLVGIRGARGVGKTTLMLQHLANMGASSDEALFASLDNIYFSEHRLYDFATDFSSHGGKYLFLDEVHKYPNWSQELKNIYDDLPDLYVVFTGSSLLSLKDGNADLSRRVVMHDIYGLSLREYAMLSGNLALPKVSFDDILHHGDEISDSVLGKIKPLQLLDEYLHYGYYPFVLEGRDIYYQRLLEVVGYILEAELPQLRDVEVSMIPKVRQLLAVISQCAPFTPNITKLSERIGMARTSMLAYLQALQESRLTLNMSKPNRGVSSLQKPDKIYIDNTNLMYALVGEQCNIGNIRETFFANQSVNAGLDIAVSELSDFLVAGRYTFEIGGAGKGRKQISSIADAYTVIDNVEYGAANRLPLWHFGLLT